MKRKRDFSNKPYNKCLFCDYRGVSCDGPRTSAMTLDRWCEFMRDMKDIMEISNQEISERSGVSLRTVDRLMSGRNDQDIMRETARTIENAIIGSSNQYPCYLAFIESTPDKTVELMEAQRELERVVADNQDFRIALDNIHSAYAAEMQKIRDEAQGKIDYLKEQLQHMKVENDSKRKIIEKLLDNQ